MISLALLSGSAAQAGTKTDNGRKWIRGLYVAESPAPEFLPRSVAFSAARQRASAEAGAFVLTGTGRSMEPLYASGTIMVVARKKFEELRRGQTILYRNRANVTVAHVLVAKCADGWRVAGLNNRVHDNDGVRPENLLGVVVAAITPVVEQSVALR